MAKLAFEQLQSLLKHPGQLSIDGPIYCCMDLAFKARLQQYLHIFEALRGQEGKRLEIQTLLALPYSLHSPDWKLRRESVNVMRSLLGRRNYSRILEVSSWNGWLSKYLQEYTPQLITLDYFSDPQDGLKAVQHYPEPWTAIQCDLEQPDLFNTGFDMIVINHSLPYTGDPLAMARKLSNMLNPGGRVVILGIPFFPDPSRHRQQLEQTHRYYQDTFNFELYIHPVKGWLDMQNRTQLQEAGYRLYPYPGLWIQKLRGLLSPYSPRYQYAVYQA